MIIAAELGIGAGHAGGSIRARVGGRQRERGATRWSGALGERRPHPESENETLLAGPLDTPDAGMLDKASAVMATSGF